MNATGARSLEDRLRGLEDLASVQQLLAKHPIAVDSGAASFWLGFWTDDSATDRPAAASQQGGTYAGVYGKNIMLEEILERSRDSGRSHITTPAQIEIEGDQATATNCIVVIERHGDDSRVRGTLVNRWEFRRTDRGWRIARRVMRPADHPDARGLMLAATSTQKFSAGDSGETLIPE